MTNKDIAEFMLNKFQSYGFTPYNIEYGDSYFIFNRGENSVVHFRLKKVWKSWKFGMWIESESLNNGKDSDIVVQLFCQNNSNIDKFKPSASSICAKISKEAINFEKENKYNYFYEVKDMLNMIKNHPFLAYNIDNSCNKFLSEHYMVEFFKDKIQELYHNIYHTVKKIIIPYTKLKIFFAKRNKIIKDLSLIPSDFYGQDYSLNLCFTKNSTLEEENQWLNKWFKKNNYGLYDKNLNNYILKLDGCKKEGATDFFWFE